MTLKDTFAIGTLSNSHTSGNKTCIIYDTFVLESRLVISTVFENGLCRATGSYVHCKCVITRETVPDGVVLNTDH